MLSAMLWDSTSVLLTAHIYHTHDKVNLFQGMILLQILKMYPRTIETSIPFRRHTVRIAPNEYLTYKLFNVLPKGKEILI